MSRLKTIGFILIEAVVAVVLSQSCDIFTYKRPFPDAYYDSNFIETLGFSEFAATAGDLPAAVDGFIPRTSARWELVYRHREDWDLYEYIGFAQDGLVTGLSGAVPQGLSASAPVYRLELRNLLADGSFESPFNAGEWATTAEKLADLDTMGKIKGANSVRLTVPQNQTLVYTPAPRPGFTTQALDQYRLSWLVKDGISQLKRENSDFSPDVNGDPFEIGFTKGLESMENYYVDDFSAIQIDGMTLSMHLSPQDTTPALEQGVYSFSVWVYTGIETPVAVDSVIVGLKSINSGVQASGSVNAPLATGWANVQASLSTNALQFDGVNTPVLELFLDFGASLPGEMLIAAPSLTFYPDGL